MSVPVEVFLVVTAFVGLFTVVRWLTRLLLSMAAKLWPAVAKIWKGRPRRPNRLSQLEQRLDSLRNPDGVTRSDIPADRRELLEGTKVAA